MNPVQQIGNISVAMAVLAMMIILAVYVGLVVMSRMGSPRFSYADPENDIPIALGKNSKWFEGPDMPRTCRAWFTCRDDGSRLSGVYLKHGDAIVPLVGLGDEKEIYVDKRNDTPHGMQMGTCVGRGNGISLTYNPDDTYLMPHLSDLYNTFGDDVIILTIRSGDASYDKYYVYDLPSKSEIGTDIREQNASVVMTFDAETGNVSQRYVQTAEIQSCL